MSGTLHYFYESYGESAPLAVPPSVEVTAISSRVKSATATFTECPAPFPGQPTIWYVATAVPTTGGAPVTAQGDHSPITIGGLTNGAEYSISVTAHNFVGASEPCTYVAGLSSVIHIFDVPAAPTLNDVIQIDKSTLKLDFTKASYDGGTPVIQYMLYLVNPQGVAYQWHLITGGNAIPVVGSSPATVPNLALETDYSITVTAVNGAGESLPSNIVFKSTPKAPHITGVSLTGGVGSAAVSISADGFGAAIDSYKIFFYRQNNLSVPFKTVTTTSAYLTVKALPPAEVMTVKIQGHNQWGWGALSSDNVQLSGVEGGMFAPNVVVDKVASRNVHVTIDQPSDNVEAWDYAILHGFVRYKVTDSAGNIYTLAPNATTRQYTGWIYPTNDPRYGDPADLVNGTNPANGTPMSFFVEVESHTYGLSSPTEDFSFTCKRRPDLVIGTRLVPTGSTSLYAEWDAPETNGGTPVLDYFVTLWECTPNVLSDSLYGADPARCPAWTRVIGKDVTTTGYSCSYDGLKSGKAYMILAQARNEVGMSYPNYDAGVSQYYDGNANMADALLRAPDLDTPVTSEYSWMFMVAINAPIGGAPTIGLSGSNWTWHPRAGGTNVYRGVTATKRAPTVPGLASAYTTSASMDSQIVFKITAPALPTYDPTFQRVLNAGDVSNAIYNPNCVRSVIYDTPSYYSLEDSAGNVYWQGNANNNDIITIGASNGPIYKLRLRSANDCGWSAYSGYVTFQPQGAPSAIPTSSALVCPIWNGQIYVMLNYDGSATGSGNGYAVDQYVFKIVNSATGAIYYNSTLGTTVMAPSTEAWVEAKYGAGARYQASGGNYWAYYANMPNLGQSWDFYCKVHNARGWTDYSYLGSTVNGTPPSAPRYAPSVKSDLLQITFNWLPPAALNGFAVDYYELYWNDGVTTFYADSRNPNHATTTDTSYTVGGLRPNTNYFMYVRAVNAMGVSGWYSTGYVLTQNVPTLAVSLTPVAGKYSEGTTDGVIIVNVLMSYGADNNNANAGGTPVDWVQIFNNNTNGLHTSMDLVWEGYLGNGTTKLVIGGFPNGIPPNLGVRVHNAIGWCAVGGWNGMNVPYGLPLAAPTNFHVGTNIGIIARYAQANSTFTPLPNITANNNGSSISSYRIYTTHGEVINGAYNGQWLQSWIGGATAMYGANVGFYLCAINAAGEGPMAYTECQFNNYP